MVGSFVWPEVPLWLPGELPLLLPPLLFPLLLPFGSLVLVVVVPPLVLLVLPLLLLLLVLLLLFGLLLVLSPVLVTGIRVRVVGGGAPAESHAGSCGHRQSHQEGGKRAPPDGTSPSTMSHGDPPKAPARRPLWLFSDYGQRQLRTRLPEDRAVAGPGQGRHSGPVLARRAEEGVAGLGPLHVKVHVQAGAWRWTVAAVRSPLGRGEPGRADERMFESCWRALRPTEGSTLEPVTVGLLS